MSKEEKIDHDKRATGEIIVKVALGAYAAFTISAIDSAVLAAIPKKPGQQEITPNGELSLKERVAGVIKVGRRAQKNFAHNDSLLRRTKVAKYVGQESAQLLNDYRAASRRIDTLVEFSQNIHDEMDAGGITLTKEDLIIVQALVASLKDFERLTQELEALLQKGVQRGVLTSEDVTFQDNKK